MEKQRRIILWKCDQSKLSFVKTVSHSTYLTTWTLLENVTRDLYLFQKALVEYIIGKEIHIKTSLNNR